MAGIDGVGRLGIFACWVDHKRTWKLNADGLSAGLKGGS